MLKFASTGPDVWFIPLCSGIVLLIYVPGAYENLASSPDCPRFSPPRLSLSVLREPGDAKLMKTLLNQAIKYSSSI